MLMTNDLDFERHVRVWALYCRYLKLRNKMFSENGLTPNKQMQKITDPLQIEAKKQAMLQHNIMEETEPYDEYDTLNEPYGFMKDIAE